MATLGDIQDSIDLLTVEVSALKKNTAQNSEAITKLGNLRAEVGAVVQAGAKDSVTAINSGIQNLQKTTKDNLQEAVKAVKEEAKKISNPSEYISKKDLIAWVMLFVLGFALCFLVVQQYTVKLVSDNFHKQIQELAAEPLKEAEKEAKKIIEEAQKKAKLILSETEKKGVDK